MKSVISTIVTTIAIFSLVGGCAPVMTVPIQQQRTSYLFTGSKESVWPLLVSEIALNYPIQVIEKESGIISTQFVQMDDLYMDRYVFPQRAFLPVWNGLRMTLRVMAIEIEPGKTQVTINAHYEAYESNVLKQWIVFRSNGSVENQILTTVENKLPMKATNKRE